MHQVSAWFILFAILTWCIFYKLVHCYCYKIKLKQFWKTQTYESWAMMHHFRLRKMSNFWHLLDHWVLNKKLIENSASKILRTRCMCSPDLFVITLLSFHCIEFMRFLCIKCSNLFRSLGGCILCIKIAWTLCNHD